MSHGLPGPVVGQTRSSQGGQSHPLWRRVDAEMRMPVLKDALDETFDIPALDSPDGDVVDDAGDIYVEMSALRDHMSTIHSEMSDHVNPLIESLLAASENGGVDCSQTVSEHGYSVVMNFARLVLMESNVARAGGSSLSNPGHCHQCFRPIVKDEAGIGHVVCQQAVASGGTCSRAFCKSCLTRVYGFSV